MKARWVRSAVAAILAAVAVIVTLFPPPALPLRWLPAVSALVLAAMLIWSQRERPPLPSQHADELRRLGTFVINDLNSKRPIQFPGTALEIEQLHQAFRAHFRHYTGKLEKWDALAKRWNESLLAIDEAANRISIANGFQTGGGALSAVAHAHTNGVSPTPVALNDAPTANKTTILYYGQNPIADLSDPTAQQVALQKGQFQNLVGGVGTWPEVQKAHSILVEVQALQSELSKEAARISMSHNLSVSSKCPICPQR